jgi:hypothetical protein
MVTVSHREASSEGEAETRVTHKMKNMVAADKLNLNQPMTRQLKLIQGAAEIEEDK